MKRTLACMMALLMALLAAASLLGCGSGKADLGEATFKDPGMSALVSTEKWGYAAVNQIVLVFEDGVGKREAEAAIAQLGGTVVGQMELINLYQIETGFATEAELSAAIDEALGMDGVEAAFPNVLVFEKDVEGTPCTPLNDPIFQNAANAAHYKVIGMENAWRILKGSGVTLSEVHVGVLDRALYTGTGEFNGKVNVDGDATYVTEYDSSGELVYGGLNHGTMVTHIIGADHENGGVTGVAGVLDEKLTIQVKNLYDGENDYSRVLADSADITQAVGWSNATHTIKGLVYLKEQVESGATVINCSFGPKVQDDSYEWIAKAYEKFFNRIHETHPHVVFVASAGNEADAAKTKGGLNGKNYFPGGLSVPNLITVGALQSDGKRADFSNFATAGAEVTLSAPGVEMVVGTDENGDPVKADGTSLSAPQVAAAIALIQSVNPGLSADEVKAILTETAGKGVTTGDTSIPIPEGMGAGVLRVDQAVLKAVNGAREAQGQQPLTMEEAVSIGMVSLRAAGGPVEYTVTAGIAADLGDGTDVSISVTGKHGITGKGTQFVAVGGTATWQITLEDEPVYVCVTRDDNGGCATMTLETGVTNADIAGSYAGTSTWDTYIENHVDSKRTCELKCVITPSGTGGGVIDIIGSQCEYVFSDGTITFTIDRPAIRTEDGATIGRKGPGTITFTRVDGKISCSGSMDLILIAISGDEIGTENFVFSLTKTE